MNLRIRLCLALLLLVFGLLFPQSRATAQSVTIPAGKVDQIVYVANAMHRLDLDDAQEKVALAIFVNKVYAANPNAHAGIIQRVLISAQERYDSRYKSTTPGGGPRFIILPFDSQTNMFNLLAATPGCPVASEMLSQSIGLAMRTGNRLGSSTDWLEMSNSLGRMRVNGGFEEHRGVALEDLHTLARSNVEAAKVVDTFFRPYFNARPQQTARQILDANPALRDSQNFIPIVAMIQPDGTLQTTLANSRNVMRSFYTNMEGIVTSNLNFLAQANLLQTNYAASFYDPNSVQQVAAIIQQAQAVAPTLQTGNAAAYITPFSLQPDPRQKEYKLAVASLRVAARVASVSGEFLDMVQSGIDLKPNKVVSGGFKMAAATLDLTSASLDLAAINGAFGKSTEAVTLEGVNKLSQQLGAVQVQINNRLDRIDANIAMLYTQMNDQFAAVNVQLQRIQSTLAEIQNAVYGLQSSVLNVQSSIDRLTQNIYLFEFQSGRETLKTYLSEADLYARNTLFLSQERYITLYSYMQLFAVNTCRTNASEIGPAVNSRLYDDYNIVTELAGSPNPEWNTNYILEFARVRFNQRQFPGDTVFTVIAPLVTPGSTVANPKSWEMSVAGMMRIAAHQPDLFALTTVNDTANNGAGFFGGRTVGRTLQNAVANVTLKSDGTRNSLFDNLLLHYARKVTELTNALIALENEGGTLAQQVTRIETQWASPNPSVPNGIALQNASKALDGAKLMLDSFLQFGLSRTLERSDLLKSLMFSDQKLPDGTFARNFYNAWVSGNNPRLTLSIWITERKRAITDLINNTLTEIETNTLKSGVRIGEPLASVDAMLLRMEAITMTRINGKVRPATGGFLPGDPITLTFRGTGRTFTVPVLLDAQGNFSIAVPDDSYLLLARGQKFLQKQFSLPLITTFGNIPSQNNNVIVDLPLLVGDASGDNVVDNRDLIILRNAWGSTPSSRNWNPLADLNNDNVVNQLDMNLLRANWGIRGDQ